MTIKNVKAYVSRTNKDYFSKENLRFFGVERISEGVLIDDVLYFYEKQVKDFSSGTMTSFVFRAYDIKSNRFTTLLRSTDKKDSEQVIATLKCVIKRLPKIMGLREREILSTCSSVELVVFDENYKVFEFISGNRGFEAGFLPDGVNIVG